MNRSTGPRKTANLSKSLNQQLNSYAVAATAAGVSVLALGQPAEAKVVYTPAHVVISKLHPHYYLDLNHDGTKDFLLSHTYQPATSHTAVGSGLFAKHEHASDR